MDKPIIYIEISSGGLIEDIHVSKELPEVELLVADFATQDDIETAEAFQILGRVLEMDTVSLMYPGYAGKYKSHVGHDIECVQYGNDTLGSFALECVTCNEVLSSEDY